MRSICFILSLMISIVPSAKGHWRFQRNSPEKRLISQWGVPFHGAAFRNVPEKRLIFQWGVPFHGAAFRNEQPFSDSSAYVERKALLRDEDIPEEPDTLMTNSDKRRISTSSPLLFSNPFVEDHVVRGRNAELMPHPYQSFLRQAWRKRNNGEARWELMPHPYQSFLRQAWRKRNGEARWKAFVKRSPFQLMRAEFMNRLHKPPPPRTSTILDEYENSGEVDSAYDNANDLKRHSRFRLNRNLMPPRSGFYRNGWKRSSPAVRSFDKVNDRPLRSENWNWKSNDDEDGVNHYFRNTWKRNYPVWPGMNE